jgi:hypothetical protein
MPIRQAGKPRVASRYRLRRPEDRSFLSRGCTAGSPFFFGPEMGYKMKVDSSMVDGGRGPGLYSGVNFRREGSSLDDVPDLFAENGGRCLMIPGAAQ